MSPSHATKRLGDFRGGLPDANGSVRNGRHQPTLMARVVTERSGLLIANAAAEFGQAQSVMAAGLASTLCVPLWSKEKILGVLQVDNRDRPGIFTGKDLEAVTVAAKQISLAAENVSLMEQIREAEQRLAGENLYLKRDERAESETGLIGDSPAMRTVIEEIGKVRDTRVPVLVQEKPERVKNWSHAHCTTRVNEQTAYSSRRTAALWRIHSSRVSYLGTSKVPLRVLTGIRKVSLSLQMAAPCFLMSSVKCRRTCRPSY